MSSAGPSATRRLGAATCRAAQTLDDDALRSQLLRLLRRFLDIAD